jgi:hypothetical protein
MEFGIYGYRSAMHHTQPCHPSHAFLPLAAAAGVMDCVWNALPLVRRPAVFGATALKWYSKTAAPRAILAGGRSRSGMGMVLADAGATSGRPRGSSAKLSAGTTRDEWGENDMMHLQAMRALGPSRPHFVAS